jgi:hypothetical protein
MLLLGASRRAIAIPDRTTQSPSDGGRGPSGTAAADREIARAGFLTVFATP